MSDFEAMFAPLDGFLIWLARGFELPFIVEPDRTHHGHYNIVLIRYCAGRSKA